MAQFVTLIEHLEAAIGHRVTDASFSAIGGGCINSAYLLESSAGNFFIKVNTPKLADMFAAEAQGLEEMYALHTVRVPQVICHGLADGVSYLALEYIPLNRLRGKASTLLGQQLAELHRIEQPFFGWHRDNTIGSTPQINQRHHDWVSFWRDERLAKQLALAASQGFTGRLQRQGERLLQHMDSIMADHHPTPALLHGDLWGGNAASDAAGKPVIFDPACYYGDRETDLAMTELFGGFGSDFFAAYHEAYPLPDGYALRKTLYNLYHILNHLNLFGAGYLSQAESMMDRLLTTI